VVFNSIGTIYLIAFGTNAIASMLTCKLSCHHIFIVDYVLIPYKVVFQNSDFTLEKMKNKTVFVFSTVVTSVCCLLPTVAEVLNCRDANVRLLGLHILQFSGVIHHFDQDVVGPKLSNLQNHTANLSSMSTN
jgi:hypothetical protein